MTYIGSEVIISPLGKSADENWRALCENRSGIMLAPAVGFDREAIFLSKIAMLQGPLRFQQLIIWSLSILRERIDAAILSSDRTAILISSTKGALEDNAEDQFAQTCAEVMVQFGLKHTPIVISNACISGVLTLNIAGNMVKSSQFEHVIVIGCDVVSNFVLYGFQSLFAVSDKPCAPFDVSRNGITLGEGCGAVLVSQSDAVFSEPPLRLLPGNSANDANHISGPSRTGEGLVRSVLKTLRYNEVTGDEIDFISAHGTGTVFNDEMESIAFDNLNLSHIPLNSLKGYYGHTLGAAGVIETIISMQMMRNSYLLKSYGYENSGVSRPLNIITESGTATIKTILKTASGFGGGNASLLVRAI